jgi:putative FmdB family regulatory protein
VPLYEYQCRSCESRFEQLVFNTKSEIFCRECGSSNVVQLLSTFAVGNAAARSAPDPGPCGACGAAQRGMCNMN